MDEKLRSGRMNPQEEALFFFRKIVYALYLEIGALQPRIHPEIAAKADITNQYFQGDKQKQAAALYRQVEDETDTRKITAPYEERTGLTLEDIYRAFAEGDWRNKFGGYNQGGPKWAKIAQTALELRRQIEAQNWEATAELVYTIKKLKTNQGFLVHLFDWSERRRA